MRLLIEPVAEDVHEVKLAVQAQNGRVGRLEEDRVRRDAGDGVRAEMAQQAVDEAARKAAELASRRDWSQKKIGYVVAVGVAVLGAVSTLAALAAHFLTHL